jgi:hypothetical protein
LEPGFNFPSTSASASNMDTAEHPPIDIELIASGYARFRKDFLEHSLAKIYGPGSAAAKGETFSRAVVMEYRKGLMTQMKEALLSVEQTVKRHRSGSTASVASGSGETPVALDSSPTSGSTLQGMRAVGYKFFSPWGGKCVFVTRADGRSLECRYYPNGSSNTSYTNALIDAPHSKATFSVVSVMTYNLWDPSDPAAKYRRTTASRMRFRQTGNSVEDGNSNDEPAYNPIGAEHAGGGLNGREAKLAKLTIMNEGFKMLDLLVAVNVGIWWQAYKKTF